MPPLGVELTSLARNAVASAFFGANFTLLAEAGYFDIAAHLKPLLHLWSLGIEEQFYLAWPFALWLTPRRWRGTPPLHSLRSGCRRNSRKTSQHSSTFIPERRNGGSPVHAEHR